MGRYQWDHERAVYTQRLPHRRLPTYEEKRAKLAEDAAHAAKMEGYREMAREGLNKVMLIGNLGNDPELKFTQSGKALLRMRLATSESYVRQDGERQEHTEWHTVIMWGKRGEALSRIVTKGQTIYVEGKNQTREWESQDGGKRSSTEVIAREILLLGGGRGRDQGGERREQRGGGPIDGHTGKPLRGGYGGQRQQRPQPQRNQGGGPDFPADDFGDDDIPF